MFHWKEHQIIIIIFHTFALSHTQSDLQRRAFTFTLFPDLLNKSDNIVWKEMCCKFVSMKISCFTNLKWFFSFWYTFYFGTLIYSDLWFVHTTYFVICYVPHSHFYRFSWRCDDHIMLMFYFMICGRWWDDDHIIYPAWVLLFRWIAFSGCCGSDMLPVSLLILFCCLSNFCLFSGDKVMALFAASFMFCVWLLICMIWWYYRILHIKAK